MKVTKQNKNQTNENNNQPKKNTKPTTNQNPKIPHKPQSEDPNKVFLPIINIHAMFYAYDPPLAKKQNKTKQNNKTKHHLTMPIPNTNHLNNKIN